MKADGRFRHGLAKKHPLYGRWVGMRQRCNDPNHSGYARYGGAGIKVCERWNSFASFLEDMGECPAGMELERLDNSLGYSPENCVWASPSEQAKNRSMTVWIERGGVKKCLSAWAHDLNLSCTTLKERIEKWGVDVAFQLPRYARGKKFKQATESKAK